jgi:hypothetical protein
MWRVVLNLPREYQKSLFIGNIAGRGGRFYQEKSGKSPGAALTSCPRILYHIEMIAKGPSS